MKILVTGAGGVIGRKLCKRLSDEDHWVTALLQPGESEENVAATSFQHCDIAVASQLKGLFRDHDMVIHAAEPVFMNDPDECDRIVRKGTFHVVDGAVRCRVRRLIYISSADVYGWQPEAPFSEDRSLIETGDAYADAKIGAEEIIRSFASRGEVEATVIRPTRIYGNEPDRLMQHLFSAFQSGDFRMIGDGDNTVHLTHVEDLACFVLLVMRRRRSEGRTITLTHPENPTWKTLVPQMATLLGCAEPTKSISFKQAMLRAKSRKVVSRMSGKQVNFHPRDIRWMGCSVDYDVRQMRDEMGFTPGVKLLDGMRQLTEMWKDQPSRVSNPESSSH